MQCIKISIVMVCVVLFACNAIAGIVTLSGERYFEIGNNSFLVQSNGSIDNADAKAIAFILRNLNEKIRAELDQRDIMKQSLFRNPSSGELPEGLDIYNSIHRVYKGEHLGEIYKECLFLHIAFIKREIYNYTYDSRALKLVSKEITMDHNNGSGYWTAGCRNINMVSPFQWKESSDTKDVYGESEAHRVANNYCDQGGNYEFRSTYISALDALLSRIYDNSYIRGVYDSVEKALEPAFGELKSIFNRVEKFNRFDVDIVNTMLKYTKDPSIRTNLRMMAR